MSKIRNLVVSSACTLLLIAAGCATPMMPSGGPHDRTPPEMVTSEPAAGAVNVSAEQMTVEFSKPIDEASLRQALAIAPDFELPPHITVRGRRATIGFPDELRENTTYVLTIGTEMRDLRNNRLPEPITLAFATGPQLDEGRIQGWVRDPESGAPLSGVNLFAYHLPTDDAPPPDPRTTAPDYRTESGAQGTFQFQYLRDAAFFVIAVQDHNRNRRVDPGEPFAVPPEPSVRPVAAPEDEPPLVPLYLTSVDTLAPEPLRVRPRTDRELALRFTEAVVLHEADTAAFAVVDSAAGRRVDVRAVYPDEDHWQIVLETEPLERVRHELRLERPAAVRDSAGNPAAPRPMGFTPAPPGEVAPAEIIAFEPAGPDTLRTLRPGELAAVRFSRPPDDPPARERITATAPDGSTRPAAVETLDGVRYTVEPEQLTTFQLRVRQPDSLHVVTFQPLPADSLGDLTGVVLDAPAGSRVVVEASKPDGYTLRTTVVDSTFALRNLPSGSYRLRVFATAGESDRWEGGLLAPYQPPQPLVIRPSVRVRARWETELEPIVLDPAAAPLPTPPAPEDPPDELRVPEHPERDIPGRLPFP